MSKTIKTVYLQSVIYLIFVFITGCQLHPSRQVDLFFDGQLVDENQHAVVGAKVSLQGKVTTTNSNGCFLFRKIGKSETLELKISDPNYHEVTDTVPFGNYRAIALLKFIDNKEKSVVRVEPILLEHAKSEPCIPE